MSRIRLVSMLLLPLMCVVVRSAKQISHQNTKMVIILAGTGGFSISSHSL